jgi:hypothetical protein
MTGDPPTDGVFGRELSLSRGIAYVLVSQHIDWKMAFKRSADRTDHVDGKREFKCSAASVSLAVEFCATWPTTDGADPFVL